MLVYGLPIYAFILMFNSNIWPNCAPLQEGFEIRVILTLTFQCQPRSNVMVPLDSPHMVSYDIYSNHMSNAHRLAVLATYNAFQL